MKCKHSTPKIIRTIINIVFIICVIIFIAFLLCKNIKEKNFWDASAIDVATIIIAVVLSYYLVQKETRKMKQKDIILCLIERLQQQVENEAAYHIEGQSIENILMNNRDISNKIHILESTASTFISEKSLKFIRNKFTEYETFIGDHREDLDYLQKSTKELKRPLDLIATRLTEISIELYR